jgi:hypothetical protein
MTLSAAIVAEESRAKEPTGSAYYTVPSVLVVKPPP